MKKYVVIAKKWDSELCEQIEVIAGEFSTYTNAKLFAEAYNAKYKATARIAAILND